MSSPGKKVFTFAMWMALIPFVIFALLIGFLNIIFQSF